jgi:glutamine synthetase
MDDVAGDSAYAARGDRNAAQLRHAARRRSATEVVDHYTRAAEVEQEAFDAVVTDYEVARGFERA